MKHHRHAASGGAVVVLVGLALVADGAGNRAHPRIAAAPGPVTQVVVQHRTLRVVRHRRLPTRPHAHHTSRTRTATGARRLARPAAAPPAHSAAGQLTAVTRIRYGARPRPARSTRPVVPATPTPTPATAPAPAPQAPVTAAPQPVTSPAPAPTPVAASPRPAHRPRAPAATTPTRTTPTRTAPTTTTDDD